MTQSEITVQFKKAWQMMLNAKSIILTTHESTDGDDLGSLLAVMRALEQKRKKVVGVVKRGVPTTLKFLPGVGKINGHFVRGDYDLLVTFGCSKPERPGIPELIQLNIDLINFDHHPDNSHFGDINVVDPRTAAVAELVYYFLDYNNLDIDDKIATCLLTGIFTDTGGFKHANTSAEVLKVAAELMKRGARIDKIASFTFGKKRPQTIRAWSKALENTRFDPERQMVFSVLTEEEFKELGASDEDMQGFVELINHIPQAKFAMLLRQDGDIVKGSLRSELHKGVDVSQIAHSFGGGGHKLAAGFKVPGKLVVTGNTWKII